VIDVARYPDNLPRRKGRRGRNIDCQKKGEVWGNSRTAKEKKENLCFLMTPEKKKKGLKEAAPSSIALQEGRGEKKDQHQKEVPLPPTSPSGRGRGSPQGGGGGIEGLVVLLPERQQHLLCNGGEARENFRRAAGHRPPEKGRRKDAEKTNFSFVFLAEGERGGSTLLSWGKREGFGKEKTERRKDSISRPKLKREKRDKNIFTTEKRKENGKKSACKGKNCIYWGKRP